MTVATQRVVKIKAEPLTAEAFAPFGTLVNPDRSLLSCTVGQYTARLMTLMPMEPRFGRINRHFDHTQLFVPITGDPCLIEVAPAHVDGASFDAEQIRVFYNDGSQAWTFNTGVWHNAPRAIGKSDARVINVQGSQYLQHTELIDFGEATGAMVEVEL